MLSNDHEKGSSSLVNKIDAAEETLDASLSSIEHKRGKNIRERIDRIRLFRKLLVNIRLNAHLFEKNTPVQLRINQLQALQDLILFIENEGNGDRTGYFVQPSGAGKTVLYGVIARLMDVQTVVLVPRSNLLEQVKRDFTETIGYREEDIGLCGEQYEEIGRKVTIANYQSHLARMRRDSSYRRSMAECELVICDEAHRSLGQATGESIDSIDDITDPGMNPRDQRMEEAVFRNMPKYAGKQSLKLGFTATPHLVRKSVQDRFQTMISQTSYSDLVRAGILAKFRVLQFPALVGPDEVKDVISSRQEKRIIEREDIYRKATELLIQLRQEVRERLLPIAFCSTIQACDRYQDVANSFGLKCEVVTGRECRNNNDPISRAEKKLLDGEIDLIASVDKLQVGWDFPPLNTVLQLRATLSPAVLVQQAGRASRCEPGKHYSYVIEPSWRRNRLPRETLQRRGEKIEREDANVPEDATQDEKERTSEQEAPPFYWEKKSRHGKGKREENEIESIGKELKYHKTPLTLAEAMNLIGEKDVDAVCEGRRGEKLNFGSVLQLTDNGTVMVGKDIGVGLNVFAVKHDITYSILQEKTFEAGLKPIGFALHYSQYIPVYKLNDIHQLPYVQDRLNLERLSREGGEVVIQGSVCVGLCAFCSLHELSYGTLKKYVDLAGLKPIDHAVSARKVEVYRKSDLEALPYVQKQSQLRHLDPESDQATIKGQSCTGLHLFATLHGLTPEPFIRNVEAAGIQPLGKALHKAHTIDVFPIRELEKLPFVQDRNKLRRTDIETGEVEIKGIQYVGLSALCRVHPSLTYKVLGKYVEEAQLKFKYALSGASKIKVYKKDEVLTLPYVQDRIGTENLTRLDSEGEVVIGTEKAVGLSAYCNRNQMEVITLLKAVERTGITGIGFALSGNARVEVFRKTDIEQLPYVREHLKGK